MAAAPMSVHWAALEVLERRLDPASPSPIAAAFSGGGDSLALLLAARVFAEGCGRPLIALHVDHGLQPMSAAWADGAGETASRLGIPFVRLAWTGPKPETGLPAAARRARHALLAEAAREAGASVLLMGHTLDDQLENALMRGAGAPVGVLREWSPSPVWPEGRGLFLCRPLLALRRAELRGWLGDEGLAWLDDPANDDLRHPRARARRAIAEGAAPALEAVLAPHRAGIGWRADEAGAIAIAREGLTRVGSLEAQRLLQIAAACASGSESLSRPARARGLLARLSVGERFVATLGGARVEASGDSLVLTREAGEAARGGLGPLTLEAGRATVWDGRFELMAGGPGWRVEALRGQASRLDPVERRRLVGFSPAARPALPALRKLDDPSAPPRLALAGARAHIDGNGVRCRALCEQRMAAAVGFVTRETEIGQAEIGTIARMANLTLPSYVGMESKD
jgi:tRNA(Ile)-lysidine synthase